MTRCKAFFQIKKETGPSRHDWNRHFSLIWLNIRSFEHFEQTFYFNERSKLASQISKLNFPVNLVELDRSLISGDCRISNAYLVVGPSSDLKDFDLRKVENVNSPLGAFVIRLKYCVMVSVGPRNFKKFKKSIIYPHLEQESRFANFTN